MEESMKFNSQVCTTMEQSERLLELGLKPETADMRYNLFEGDLEPCIMVMPWNSICVPCQNNFPAWSLHRLLCMLDYDIADTFNIMPNLAYRDVIATISLSINRGLFNKEYLKQ